MSRLNLKKFDFFNFEFQSNSIYLRLRSSKLLAPGNGSIRTAFSHFSCSSEAHWRKRSIWRSLRWRSDSRCNWTHCSSTTYTAPDWSACRSRWSNIVCPKWNCHCHWSTVYSQAWASSSCRWSSCTTNRNFISSSGCLSGWLFRAFWFVVLQLTSYRWVPIMVIIIMIVNHHWWFTNLKFPFERSHSLTNATPFLSASGRMPCVRSDGKDRGPGQLCIHLGIAELFSIYCATTRSKHVILFEEFLRHS